MHRFEIATVALLFVTFILVILAGIIDQLQRPAFGRAAPTTVSFPTFTNTPSAPPAQKTLARVQSLPPTATPILPTSTPRPPTVIVNSNMNVRQGPGTNYAVIGGASPGQEFAITGTDAGARQWFQIDYIGRAGWIYAPLVTASPTPFSDLLVLGRRFSRRTSTPIHPSTTKSGGSFPSVDRS